MVSIAQTSRKYRGRKAETYDLVRQKQMRWRVENEVVARMLSELRPSSILDCPVGTGRFLQLYADLGVQEVIGVDASDEMLALARKKIPRRKVVDIDLQVGDARAHACKSRRVDVAVCVRFLDLIDEEAMREVVKELCRVARRSIILTIRLGSEYVPKVNTSVHARGPFLRLARAQGWRAAEEVPVLRAGWTIVRLERKK